MVLTKPLRPIQLDIVLDYFHNNLYHTNKDYKYLLNQLNIIEKINMTINSNNKYRLSDDIAERTMTRVQKTKNKQMNGMNDAISKLFICLFIQKPLLLMTGNVDANKPLEIVVEEIH